MGPAVFVPILKNSGTYNSIYYACARVGTCQSVSTSPQQYRARKVENIDQICINGHCNDFNGATVLSTVDLASSGDKSFGYLRLGCKQCTSKSFMWLLMTSAGQFAFTAVVEILH
jgi:hypothetical protein